MTLPCSRFRPFATQQTADCPLTDLGVMRAFVQHKCSRSTPETSAGSSVISGKSVLWQHVGQSHPPNPKKPTFRHLCCSTKMHKKMFQVKSPRHHHHRVGGHSVSKGAYAKDEAPLHGAFGVLHGPELGICSHEGLAIECGRSDLEKLGFRDKGACACAQSCFRGASRHRLWRVWRRLSGKNDEIR